MKAFSILFAIVFAYNDCEGQLFQWKTMPQTHDNTQVIAIFSWPQKQMLAVSRTAVYHEDAHNIHYTLLQYNNHVDIKII